jgi:hypothetical protein
MARLDQAFQRDRFLLKQKALTISEKYYVYDDRRNPLLYIERPSQVVRQILAALGIVVGPIVVIAVTIAGFAFVDRTGNRTAAVAVAVALAVLSVAGMVALAIALTPKRHIRVYADDTKSRLLLEILQYRKVDLLRATYTVLDPQEGVLGQFQKYTLYDLFRKRWYGVRPDGSVFIVAQEDSLLKSILRRILGAVDALAIFLATNFIIHELGSTEVLGEFNRKATLFDQYVLDLRADATGILDRRLAVALGVLLDTGEHR